MSPKPMCSHKQQLTKFLLLFFKKKFFFEKKNQKTFVYLAFA